MFRSLRIIAVLALTTAIAASAAAQPQPSDAPQPLPPAAPTGSPPPGDAPAAQQPPAAPVPTRVFCEQNVGYRLAEPSSVPDPYRAFVGIFSDADWTPQLCAALIVESVQSDGTAVITYAFGPLGPGSRTAGGVLHGTGIVKDGELRFQNNDGSQFAFKPFYSDLQGRLTTPQGQTYQAVFKRTY